MIHKFWNVRLAKARGDAQVEPPFDDDASEEQRNKMRDEEEMMEERTYRIWSVLSQFEESSAACISDMLLHVSNGAYMEGVLVAKKFINYVDVLFSATDKLDSYVVSSGKNGKLNSVAQRNFQTDPFRPLLWSRGQAPVQADRLLLHSSYEDPGHWRQALRRYSRVAVAGHWPCSLP